MTAAAIASVACTISGGTMFGSTWRSAMRQRRIADRARGQHEVLGLDRERLAAREADEHRRRRDADRDHRVGEARPEERGERDREDQERAREQRIGEPRDQHVGPAARVAGEQSDGHADRQRDQHRHDAGQQRRARAPKITRDSTSRPISSVPNQCAADGALRIARPARRERIVRRDHGRQRAPARRRTRSPRGRRAAGRRASRRRGDRRAARRTRRATRRLDERIAGRWRAAPRRESAAPSSSATRIRGLTTTYAMSASRFSTMYAVAVNSTTPCTTA